MVQSTIPAYKLALYTALTKAEWPTFTVGYDNKSGRPQISYGEPETREGDCVIVGDTSGTGDDAQVWSLLGRQKRDEGYALNILVTVAHPGLTQQEATERAFALFAVVETVLRAAPPAGMTFGIAGLTVAAIRQPVHIEDIAGEGRSCSILSAVVVTGARI